MKRPGSSSNKSERAQNFERSFAKPNASTKKIPRSGKKGIKPDFEKEIERLKMRLDTSLQEKSDLMSSLEQVRRESRSLRTKLIAMGVDIGSLKTREGLEYDIEEDALRENIRLLEWRLSSLASERKATGTRKQLFLHFKGGTGKTCLAISYGNKLADLGLKVLLIDLDPQGHLTDFFKIENVNIKDTLYDVLIEGKDISNAIVETRLPNVHIIPSNLSLSAIEMPLSSLPLRGERLRIAMSTIEGDYDFIIMDSAPSIGFLALNAILSADDLLIPVLADYFSYHALKALFETIASIENDFSFSFNNIWVFLNRYDDLHEVCFSARRALETHYSDFLLKTIIHESQDIADAASMGLSVFEFKRISKGAEDILKFIFEVLYYNGGKKW